MGRSFLCTAAMVALLIGGWCLVQRSGHERVRREAPTAHAVSAPAALPEAASAERADTPKLTAPGLAGAVAERGVRWGAPDGAWTVSWGWAEVEGLPITAADLREEEGCQVAEHGSIREVFARRANGIEHSITVNEPPSRRGRLEVRIPVDADARSWDFDGQPRVTLSRPQQGDLLEVQGLCVYDAENRQLAATMGHEPGAILIQVEDDGATYPVTIDPLITPPSWTADSAPQSWSAFGTAVAGAGDFNGDGFADVVVGTARGGLERVFLYYGSAQGPAATAGWTLLRPISGSEGNPGFGSKLANAGDVNADGYPDLVVGDPGASGQSGRVMLYLGGATGPSSAPAWTGTGASWASFGQALGAAGDVNRDGRSDLLVGADGGAIIPGAVSVYYGTTTGLASSSAWTVSPTDYSARFGASADTAGDVNGDGYVDVIVGAPNQSAQAVREGRAYLYLGTSTGLSTTPAWTADPTDQENGAFGTSVAGAGDINQDGFADVLVGAPYGAPGGTAGRAYLYLGSSTGLSTTPAWVMDRPQTGAAQFGAVVLSPGDLNGDGLRDVVVSAPLDQGGEAATGGTVYVYINSPSGPATVPSVILGPTGQGDTRFGSALAAAGDTNGDARADLIVGAPNWSSPALSGEGRAYVYFGASTRTAVPWLVSPANDARLGTETPTLDWLDVPDANGIQSYDVEVDDTSDFAAPVRWSGSAPASQVATGALPEGGYFWRVRARDGAGNLSDWSLVRRVYVDGSAPSVPVPASPTNDAWTTARPRLSWNASPDFSGVQNYDVQVSPSADFSGPLEFSATTSYAIDTTTLAAGRHYWRVRARDTWGWVSAWGSSSFVVDDGPPSTPVLLAPADGAGLAMGNAPLDWNDSTDANGIRDYIVYVDNESGFTSPWSWAATVPNSQVESGTLASGTYYWRVVVRDTAGNMAASATGTFMILGSLPSVVTASTPSYGVSLANPVVNLDWSDAADPDGIQGYEAQVATDAGFAMLVWTGSTTGSNATTTALPEGPMFWHARAVDTLGNRGPWSSPASFSVDTTAPTAPSPTAPADGTVFTSGDIFLDWTDSTDNVALYRYDLEIDTDASFTPPLSREVASSWSAAYLYGLADGAYVWRVRARDAAGNVSAYGAVRSFTIDGALPPAPALLSPASGATVSTATPTLDWSDVTDPSGVTYEVVVDDDSTFVPPAVATASVVASSQWTAPWLGDCALRYWRVRAVDGLGHLGAWSATGTFTVDRGRGFYVGFGSGAGGQIAACRDEAAGSVWRPMYSLVDATYNAASGETRPAAGDLDGDGVNELVVGRGRSSASAGWFAILEDTGSGFAVTRWIQVPFSAYNAANGETWPACGDIDGDGKDEIVIGLGTYTSQGGYFALYNDASTGYAFIGWRRISWSQYNAANGETRPACGDVTGDGKAEVFVGLGRYPSRGGRVARYTSGSVAFSAWMQFSYSAYNSANGETFPACGDVDADGRDELCVGMGAYPQGGGYVQYFNDSVAKYASLGLKRLPWTAYNGAVGETRPSLGPVLGGAGDETVIGLGAWEPAAGYVAILDRAPGYGLRLWKRAPAEGLTLSAGATRPSVRR